ncbi:MAG: hypothetical protein NVV68_06880 [Dokdonella sp.]|nr:hypothetical protein [Dokdonella sp.]
MTWVTALSAYGAELDTDGFIVRAGKALGVRITEKSRRLRIESRTGQLLATGPANPATVESFVERFWHWEKRNA